MGNLIPAGTGYELYKNIRVKANVEPVSAEDILGDDFLEEKKTSEI